MSADHHRWNVRVALVATVTLVLGALASFALASPPSTTATLALIALGAYPALFLLGRRSRSLILPLGAAMVLFTAVQLLLFGATPGIAIATYAPLLVIAATASGAFAAFVLADAVALVWALASGLAAGGFLSLGSALPQGPGLTLVVLGVTALFLNAVALAGTWAAQHMDPRLDQRLSWLEHERERLAQEAEVSQPLVTAGRLVANVAHEVSNPLQAMDHFLFVLLEETPASDPRHDHLLVLKQGFDRIGQYIEQLSDFYRPSSALGNADTNRVVGDVCSFLERQLNHSEVKLTREIAPDIPPAAISDDQLRQAVLNVILNAVEAMPNGGELTVSTGRSDEWVVVAVRDTGPGISPEDLDRVFEPFFTTKSDQGGTGLGLSITQRIVRSRGGEVSAESTPGSGTEVTLKLLAAES